MENTNTIQVLLKHFPELDSQQIEQYLLLLKIFPEWNNKVNCVSRKDIDNLFVNHVLHSLSIAKKIKFPKNSHVLDVGTGGGFPGIPLAIMFKNVSFDLVDSIRKKIDVVQDITTNLGLTNVNPINTRVETLDKKYDFIISRAVTAFPAFYQLVKSKIKSETEHKKQGIIYLKGGDFENEISGFTKTEVYDIYEFFDYEHFITKKIIYLPLSKKTKK